MGWFRPELRVIFVCTANVCRSPLAEAMLRHLLREEGLGRRVKVSSAGTRAGQPGRAPDVRVRNVAMDAGIKLGRIRARQLTVKMLRANDFVLVMEDQHLDEISAFGDGYFPQSELLGNYLLNASNEREIPDPYYGDIRGFTEVFELIDTALTGLMPKIQARLDEPLTES